MPARPKITLDKIPRLQEDLRRRNHLLEELARYEFKVLAAKYDVHPTTIMRFEYAMYGLHRPDPDREGRSVRLREVVSRETQSDVQMGRKLVDTIG